MKYYYSLFFTILVINFISCKSNTQKENGVEKVSQQQTDPEILKISTQKEVLKELNLTSGFKIRAGEEEDFGDFKTYTFLEVIHNNKVVFTDSTEEYEFGDKKYPLLNQIRPNTFEILLQINDRPSKNKSKYLRIQADKITKEIEMPSFIAKAFNLDNDELLESAGFWDYAQSGESKEGAITAYNPILYYEWTTKGLLLDSALTIKKNTQIYGAFQGYDFNEEILIPVKHPEELSKEIKRLEKE